MKSALLALALLVLLPAGAVSAHETSCLRIGHSFDCDSPLRWAPRHDAGEARIAITTQDGKVTLVLTDGALAFQLSDRTMRKIDREMKRARHEHEDDDGPLGEAIKTAVLSSVRSVLDHSAECPLREIRDVRCVDGRLVIVSRDGDRLFENLDVDDEDVLDSFDPRNAAAFADEFHRLRAGAR
jgi:hypothetical protein